MIAAEDKSLIDRLLPFSCLLLIAALCCNTFVSQSLWTDEALTWWVTKDGFGDVVSRSHGFQGQSPFYYSVIWLVQQAGFGSEIALRSPSILFLLFSCFFTFKIASRLFNQKTAWFSILFFLSFNPVLVSLSARPYSLGLFLSLGSVYFFLSWLTDKRFLTGLVSGVFLLLAFYAHYLFIFSAVVNVIFLVADRGFKESVKPGLLFFVPVFLLCLPGVSHLIYLWSVREGLYFLTSPGLLDAAKAVLPPIGFIAVISGLIASLLAAGNPFPKNEYFSSKRKNLLILLCWAVSGPLVFFAASMLLKGSLFAPRYFLWSLPASAMLCAFLIANSRSLKTSWWSFGVVLVLLITLAIERKWQIEDWKSTAEFINSQELDSIFIYSGLIESETVKGAIDAGLSSYLNAPLEYYGIKNGIAVGPSFQFDLAENQKVLIAANTKFKTGSKISVGEKLAAELGAKYTQSKQHKFGTIELFLY